MDFTFSVSSQCNTLYVSSSVTNMEKLIGINNWLQINNIPR